MADLYIIAAGKGSRMGGGIPKALVPITDQPNLTTTLQQIGHKFDKVFVVTNAEIQTPWEDYFSALRDNFPELQQNLINVPIYSGRGDGHAVMIALERTAEWNARMGMQLSDDIVIAWGDVFFPHEQIINEMLSFDLRMGVIPVVFESEPYVALQLHEGEVKSASFSKYGENTRDGYHDQSVFRFNRQALAQSLSVMDVVLNKNGKYITPNGEMSLLYVFHYVHNTTQESNPEICGYETKYPTMSFNTVEEVALIQQEIDKKWKHKFRKDQS